MWPTSALLASVAFAAPELPPESAAGCAPLDEPAFRSYVLDAQASIDRGDVELPAAILAEVQEQLPCLTFAPAPRMWADLLVAWAIVEFSRGGDWEGPLAGALRIRPMIDRGVGPGHPLARWEPPSPPPSGPPVPDGVRLYVDGFASPTLPPAKGWYLVQKTDGRFWNTLLIRDTDLPLQWATDPVEQPARVRWWTRLGGFGALGSASQRPSWGSDFYPELADQQGRLGAVLDLQATFMSPFGLRAHGTASYSSSLWLDGWASVAFAPGQSTLGLGVGSATVETVEWIYPPDTPNAAPSDALGRARQLRFGLLTAGYRASGRSRWDVEATVGASPAIVRYEAQAGLLLPPLSGARMRVGLMLDGRRAVFEQRSSQNRDVVVGNVLLALRLDWVAGEY
ncbi:MAG: hypothetical protein R3F59_28255 [Myxococcota bacterium]